MRKRGEITVFLSLILVCMASLFMGLLESARTAGARLYLNMAVNSAMSSVMSQYNKNLWDMYHLLFLEFESEAAIEQSFEEYLQFYLEQENLYPMKNKRVVLSRAVTMQENEGEALEDEILSYMKYRLPKAVENLSGLEQEAAEAGKAGDFKNLFEMCMQAGKKARKLERVRRALETALAEMKKGKEELEEAAEKEKEHRFETAAEKLIKKMKRFPELVDAYEKEIVKISEHMEADGDFCKNEDCDLQASKAMKNEAEAYGTVEASAREILLQYKEKENLIEPGRICLEELEENFANSQEEGEVDWEEIRSWLELVEIPDGLGKERFDSEKSRSVDRLEDILSGELLTLVLPEGTDISERTISLKNKPAYETSGSGPKKDPVKQLLLNEYIFLCFDSFREKCTGRKTIENQALLYEQEYLLCGKAADKENLKSTVEEILAVRGAANFAYLLSIPDLRAQAEELAAVLAGGNLSMQIVISLFILALWALGEAVWDVRSLLDGGKIRFWKDETTWKLSLDGLLSLEFLNGKSEEKEDGKDYHDYLRVLFFLKDARARNYRMMDVIQWNVQTKQKDFSVGDCAHQIEIEADIVQKHVFGIQTQYEQTVSTEWSY
ncbi:DUF5702 domain-containing protein [Lachnospiraceae bacterium 45-P1]